MKSGKSVLEELNFLASQANFTVKNTIMRIFKIFNKTPTFELAASALVVFLLVVAFFLSCFSPEGSGASSISSMSNWQQLAALQQPWIPPTCFLLPGIVCFLPFCFFFIGFVALYSRERDIIYDKITCNNKTQKFVTKFVNRLL